VVHLPKEDEFLAIVRESAAMIKTERIQQVTRNGEKIYQNHKKAMNDAKHCKQEAIMCLLFDTGNQLVIAPIGD
jgi:hypothetical protein